MKLTIDTTNGTLDCTTSEGTERLKLYSREGFEKISDLWVTVGWNEKYVYTFSWLGRPIIQLPEDMIRTQEVVHSVRPDVIVETGVAHGGSLMFYASLCRLLGRGRVVGVDVDIRSHNRKAIEEHELADLITLVEGDSTNPRVVDQVRECVLPGETAMVILDSCHTSAHVYAELDAYHGLVTQGSYIVATDGVMHYLHDVPRGDKSWIDDNPMKAVQDFCAKHPEFVLEQPAWPFNESRLQTNVTHWPSAWLRRK